MGKDASRDRLAGVCSEAATVRKAYEKLFGTNSHGLLFGLVLFSGTLGGSAGPLLAGFLFDQTGTYQIVLIVLALMAIFGLFW